MHVIRFTVLILLTSSLSFSAERPNIVWLVSEDNSIHYQDMFFPGGASTPNIEALAKAGVLYRHAFSNAPVCSVARTTLATGCYGPRIGTQFHRKSIAVPMPDDLKMFPEYLRGAGYYTANNNKTDYNAVAGKNVWDQSSKKATWRNRQPDQPFFYMQSFPISHEGRLHFSRKTMQNVKTQTDPDSVKLADYHPDTATFRYTHATYLDRIMDMDRAIGEVVKQLTADGLLEDTFIFYFGDHGGVLPRGKGYAYDSGLHVPLVVRIPENFQHLVNEKRGTTQNGFVSFVDFGPTTLNLAGVDIPANVDGKPFLGTRITRDEVQSRQTAFGYADRFDEKYDLVRTVRVGRYEYVRSYQPYLADGLQNNYRYKMLAYQEWRELFLAGKLNDAQSQFFRSRPAEQLFDLEADPYEVHDLSQSPQHAEKLAELRSVLQNWVTSMPDLSFFPESVLLKEGLANPVQFGQQNSERIHNMIQTADLALADFPKARPAIAAALKDQDPWIRYWALNSCESHLADHPFAEEAKTLAATDPERLVRLKAAEYLGLAGVQSPTEVFRKELAETKDGIEAGLILNSLTLLKDTKPGYEFNLQPSRFKPSVLKNDTVKRRLEYLVP